MNDRWDRSTLDAIDRAGELRISTTRRDGTERAPTPIWSVVVDDELYVRSHYGDRGAWYRAARARGVGRIAAGGITAAVTLEPAVGGSELDDRIDAAYTAKYRGSAYLAPMLSSSARAAVLRIRPQ